VGHKRLDKGIHGFIDQIGDQQIGRLLIRDASADSVVGGETLDGVSLKLFREGDVGVQIVVEVEGGAFRVGIENGEPNHRLSLAIGAR